MRSATSICLLSMACANSTHNASQSTSDMVTTPKPMPPKLLAISYLATPPPLKCGARARTGARTELSRCLRRTSEGETQRHTGGRGNWPSVSFPEQRPGNYERRTLPLECPTDSAVVGWSGPPSRQAAAGGATSDPGDLQHSHCWTWVYCEKCLHHAPMALVPLIVRWDADTSSDRLRQRARCTKCGPKRRRSNDS
jgi:hypothetical protein